MKILVGPNRYSKKTASTKSHKLKEKKPSDPVGFEWDWSQSGGGGPFGDLDMEFEITYLFSLPK